MMHSQFTNAHLQEFLMDKHGAEYIKAKQKLKNPHIVIFRKENEFPKTKVSIYNHAYGAFTF